MIARAAEASGVSFEHEGHQEREGHEGPKAVRSGTLGDSAAPSAAKRATGSLCGPDLLLAFFASLVSNTHARSACREPEGYAQPPLRSLRSPCPCGRGEPDRPDALTQPMEANGDAFGGRSTEFADSRQSLRACFQTTSVSHLKLARGNGRAIPKVPRAFARRGPMSEQALSEHEHGTPSQNTQRSSANDLACRLSDSDLTLAKPPDHRNRNSPKNWCEPAVLPVGLCAAVRGGVPTARSPAAHAPSRALAPDRAATRAFSGRRPARASPSAPARERRRRVAYACRRLKSLPGHGSAGS